MKTESKSFEKQVKLKKKKQKTPKTGGKKKAHGENESERGHERGKEVATDG